MKNNCLKNAISLLLAFVLFISCQWFLSNLKLLFTEAEQTEEVGYEVEPVTSAVGYDSNLYLKDNYATYYFSNLTSNFGYNVKGSCSYVALGMLLSYYDTFWDDNIIPEQYDSVIHLNHNQIITEIKSPGIRDDYDVLSSLWFSNAFYYENVVEKHSDEYLHLKLIQMGQERFNYFKAEEIFPCGLTALELLNLTKYYLYDYMGYTNNQVSILNPSSTKQKDVRNFTVSMLKKGIPVILLGTADNKDSHFAVAYDYNENTDSIYVHMGSHKAGAKIYCHNNFELEGYTLNRAFAIQFNTEHSHSENYQSSINSKYLETICPCELSIHPSHVTFVDNYISVKEISSTGTTYRNYAELLSGSGKAMIVELDLNEWQSENNILPGSIKEIELNIRGKLKRHANLTITDIMTSSSLNIVQQSYIVNSNYITFVPNLNTHNKVKLLVETTSTKPQSYSVNGMSFSVKTA